MSQRGDCLSCTFLAECSQTSLKRVLTSHTCPLFDAVPGPVYQSRVMLMRQFGEEVAVEVMMQKPQSTDEEE